MNKLGIITFLGKSQSLSLATPKPESRNHLNRTCLSKWRRLKISKNNTSRYSLETQLQNKVTDIYQSGKEHKFLMFGTHENSKSHYPQMEKTWNSSELSQECMAYQNYSKLRGSSSRLSQEKQNKTTSKQLQASLVSGEFRIHENILDWWDKSRTLIPVTSVIKLTAHHQKNILSTFKQGGSINDGLELP